MTLLGHEDKLDFEFTFTISSVREIPDDKLECYDKLSSDFVKACYEGNEAKVDRMLKNNICMLNTKAACGMNGFMIACRKGFTEIVSLILKSVVKMGCHEGMFDVNDTGTEQDITGFTMAILEGHIEVVKVIAEQKPFKGFEFSFNWQDGEDGHTPLMHACKNGKKDIVNYFLKFAKSKKKVDFDLNQEDIHGNTAFHLACLNKHEEIVDLIIQSADKLKIQLDLKNEDEQTGYDLFPEKFEEQSAPGPSKKPRTDA